MTTNIILSILLILAIVGLINSIEIENIPQYKKDNDKSSGGLRKQLTKAEASDVTQINDTTIRFTCDDVPYYLDGHLEPLTALYTLFQLNDSVDLDMAKKVARDFSYECETVSIRINDNREMVICCTTITPDAKSLGHVTPYMLEVVNRSLEAFLSAYKQTFSG